MIKVSGLSHKNAKKSDPRLAWLMLQNIYLMYWDINNKEERNADIILTSMLKHKKSNK